MAKASKSEMKAIRAQAITSWTCGGCGKINSQGLRMCSKCHKPKKAAKHAAQQVGKKK